jgi:hypothetical protein
MCRQRLASTNRSVGSRPEINPAAFLSSAPHFLARGPAGKNACSLKVKIILITLDTALLHRINTVFIVIFKVYFEFLVVFSGFTLILFIFLHF